MTADILAIADLHVGSTVGLWPETFPIEDGGEARANKFQQGLLAWWWRMIEEAMELPKPPIVVVDGDVLQGANYRDGQLSTDRADIQADAAYELLKPLREICERMYILHGTAWHGGKASAHVTALARRLEAVPEAVTGRPLWWELYLEPPGGGPVIRFTHHISATSLPFYEATAPLRDYYVLNAELRRVYGEQARHVDMDVHAHRHRCIYVLKPPAVRVLTLPSWQLKNEFGHKVAANGALPDCGYVRIERDGGNINPVPSLMPLPPVHIEEG